MAEPSTAAWQQPSRLAASGQLAHAATAGDAAVVTWTDDGSIVAAYRRARGQWETDELGAGSRPRVAVNADGLAVVVWQRRVDDRAEIRVSTRTAAGGWTARRTVTSAGRYPTVAVNAAGTIRVLLLSWAVPARQRTSSVMFTFTDHWAGRTLSRGPLKNTRALRRSLTLTTNALGRPVAGWLCPAEELFARGDPRRDGWVCMHFPGSRAEPIERSPKGVYAVSSPVRRPVYLTTPFSLVQAGPGLTYYEGWKPEAAVSHVYLDVARGGGGVAAWQGTGRNGSLWVVHRSADYWRGSYVLALRTHGLSGATFAEPRTARAFWRTARGRLQTASKDVRSPWRRGGRFGRAVQRAQLVSNAGGQALLVWSSSVPGSAGVYVATLRR